MQAPLLSYYTCAFLSMMTFILQAFPPFKGLSIEWCEITVNSTLQLGTYRTIWQNWQSKESYIWRKPGRKRHTARRPADQHILLQ